MDGFQGREKEVIIISATRSNLSGDVGFLRDERRMNVAITRARRMLVFICDSSTLSSDPFLYKLCDYFKTHALNLSVDRILSTQEIQNLQVQCQNSSFNQNLNNYYINPTTPLIYGQNLYNPTYQISNNYCNSQVLNGINNVIPYSNPVLKLLQNSYYENLNQWNENYKLKLEHKPYIPIGMRQKNENKIKNKNLEILEKPKSNQINGNISHLKKNNQKKNIQKLKKGKWVELGGVEINFDRTDCLEVKTWKRTDIVSKEKVRMNRQLNEKKRKDIREEFEAYKKTHCDEKPKEDSK